MFYYVLLAALLLSIVSMAYAFTLPMDRDYFPEELERSNLWYMHFWLGLAFACTLVMAHLSIYTKAAVNTAFMSHIDNKIEVVTKEITSLEGKLTSLNVSQTTLTANHDSPYAAMVQAKQDMTNKLIDWQTSKIDRQQTITSQCIGVLGSFYPIYLPNYCGLSK